MALWVTIENVSEKILTVLQNCPLFVDCVLSQYKIQCHFQQLRGEKIQSESMRMVEKERDKSEKLFLADS